jgi:hypothetical protein
MLMMILEAVWNAAESAFLGFPQVEHLYKTASNSAFKLSLIFRIATSKIISNSAKWFLKKVKFLT